MNGINSTVYGFIAEFKTAERLIAAVERTHQVGYRKIEVYSPFPIEELDRVLAINRNRLSFFALIGGGTVAAGTYFIEYYSSVVDYPINVGGRPYHSWPALLPAAVELTILGAALAIVLGMLLLNGLPKLIHPVFNLSRFKAATRDRFFLCIKASDPQFNSTETRRFLERLGPVSVQGVEP